MKHVVFMGLALLLAACDTPSPEFWGIEPTTVTVQGSTFDIRRRGNVVEAIRTNAEYAPRLGAIARRAEYAIEQATGCPVKEIRGDQAVVVASLKCGKPNDVARIGKGTRRPVDCHVRDNYLRDKGREQIVELECQ